ncbi:equilibrative nucleoside transporter 2-like isoform X2 [Phyllopteryx taeniolatus]|uniref:equilibrative nucleoside transporter 2-like isoform X2 n=1 Tax=Phyllopteryx taeniolatus TaxID=161469 RepID=UPI002AD3BE5E|nr:equilibrative nucleoside transporter 2-like isoform X2 [Phyllopteryx taeniolatus]XP_061626098.1 equilibrative nucleoside transporter 2-like isoform X2 [Phyllopteryx taeniolatus]
MPEEKKASAPADRGNMVAAIIFMLGLGTLLPWNFFITASQYFNQRLKTSGETVKEYNYDSWMVLLSQLPLLLFTLLNSFFYQWVWEGVRVATSLVAILLLFSLTAALVEVHMTPDTFFSVTMATIWFINMFSAVLQGSLFGAVGLLPARYSTLFMTGQGLAGIFAAVAMLCSVLGNADTKSAALGYFITPCVATLGTLTCYMILPHLEFARFYLRRRSNDVDEEAKMKELLPSAGWCVKSVQFAVNLNVLSIIPRRSLADGHVVSSKDGKHLEADRRLMGEPLERSSVLLVFKKIWPMALCITCVFAVTLSVFPVVTVRVETVYKKHTDWDKVFTCVCCFVVFNAMDLVGRGTPSIAQWPSKDSCVFPCAVVSRVLFIPLLMMCNIPGSKLSVFLFHHDGAFAAIMALFAFSNGYLASLCMAYAPQLVGQRDCETAGSLMTFFLVLGLALGAALSFLLGKLL